MELYEVLGVDKGAESRDIKKAYFNLAKTHHPDKGGDAEKFKQIQRAYDVLSDDEKRNFYNQTGQVPGEQGAGGPGEGHPGGFPFDIGAMFGGMFGGGMPGMGHMGGGGGPFGMRGGPPPGPPSTRRRGKAPPKVHEIHLPLADFYKGKLLKINFERQRFCRSCHGDGFVSSTPCEKCHGMGMTMVHIQMGPGMIMQSQMPCGACSGKGHMNGPACGACSGKCFTSEENILDVTIEPGLRVGEKLVFPGACSDHQDFAEAGDVHIQVSQADEEIPWKRDGVTLAATLAINLADSLLGSTKKIGNHPGFPDGCEIMVPSGSINGQVLIIKDSGMPVRGTNRKGDAHITLLVRLEAVELAAVQKHGVLLRSIFTTAV